MTRYFRRGFICYLLFCIGLALMVFSAVDAEAKIIAEAQVSEGIYVVFHDTSGPCLGEAKLVEYVPKDGNKVPGCWVARGDKLMCVFLDGDVGAVPMAHLKDPKNI